MKTSLKEILEGVEKTPSIYEKLMSELEETKAAYEDPLSIKDQLKTLATIKESSFEDELKEALGTTKDPLDWLDKLVRK